MTSRRAPKKYADKERTRITPEWQEWNARRRSLIADDGSAVLSQIGFQPEVYFPEQDGKAIPEDGAWILVLEEPLTELRARFRVPLLSMWRARPHELNDGGVPLNGIKVYPKQAVIATPGGDLHLWAHEYIVAENPIALFGDPDATVHQLGGEPALDEDQLFYLMSRGISHQDAVAMLFDTITSSDYCYVTFPEEITELLRGVGVPLWKHIADNPRTSIAEEAHTSAD